MTSYCWCMVFFSSILISSNISLNWECKQMYNSTTKSFGLISIIISLKYHVPLFVKIHKIYYFKKLNRENYLDFHHINVKKPTTATTVDGIWSVFQLKIAIKWHQCWLTILVQLFSKACTLPVKSLQHPEKMRICTDMELKMLG